MNFQATDDAVIKLILKKLELDYVQFPKIWAEKFRWYRRLWNEDDELGIANRLTHDMANLTLAEPPKIWTPSEQVNQLIQYELEGNLNFFKEFSDQLALCFGVGDMVMSVFKDPTTGRPAINYIPGQNVIPITFHSGQVTKLAWFQKMKIEEDVYIILCVEDLYSRHFAIYKYKSGQLQMMSFGNPIWTRVLGDTQPIQEWDDEFPYKRFAWISTNIRSSQWHDTPFHNSIYYKTQLLDDLEEDWRRIKRDMKNSEKIIFVAPDVLRRSQASDLTDENGMAIDYKKPDLTSGLYLGVDMADEKYKEYLPSVNIDPFFAKMKITMGWLTNSAGLGFDFYKFEGEPSYGGATGQLLSHQKCFNTIHDIQKGLKNSLQTIIFALIQEWYNEGLIDEQEMQLIVNPHSIDIAFDDGVFVDKTQKVDMYLRVLSAPTTIPGMRMIDQYTFLTEALELSPEKARAVMGNTLTEYAQAVQIMMGTGGQAPK